MAVFKFVEMVQASQVGRSYGSSLGAQFQERKGEIVMSRLFKMCHMLLLLTCAVTLRAQEVTASITGMITDSTGAVMPHVRVVVTNGATNMSRSSETGSTGDYVITLLQPGNYTLTVSHPGFKTYVREGLILQVNQRARIDVGLSVGATTEKLDVHADVATINTENASVGKVIDSKSISLMPLNGRLNIVGLLALAPGIQNAASSQDSIPAYGVTPTVSGAPSVGAINWTIDGTSNMPPNIYRGMGDWPPLDGIQEFKAITSGASAEFDNANQVIVVTKGGANQFHGTALLYNRNRVLAARNFFSTASKKPQYNRNEFGGNFSGPVQKDRTFFFFNFEGFRRRQSSTVTSQVATSAMRAGNFTGLSTITDPLTSVAFPSNQIPTSRISSVDTQLGNLYPLPNTAGTGTAGTGYNLTESIPLREHVNRYSFRIDHNLSSSDQMHGGLTVSNLGPNPSIGATSAFGGMQGIGDHTRNGHVAWNHSFNPQTVNELRLGLLFARVYRTPQNVDLDIASIIPGLGVQGINGAPQLSITDITSMAEQGSRDTNVAVSLDDNLLWVRGNHTFKTGFRFYDGHHSNLSALSPQRGSYSFTGTYSGIAYADFVLGYPATTKRALPSSRVEGDVGNRYGVYFQDDWKVTRTLTLNVGLRYEAAPQKPETHEWWSMFLKQFGTIVVFGDQYPPAAQQRLISGLGIQLAKNVGLPTNLMDYIGQNNKNFAPRLGLAWRVRPSTVVRSAFGVYYIGLANGLTTGLMAQPPFISVETFEQPSGTVPTITMANPFPGQGDLPTNPGGVSQTRFESPYSMQWNFTLEQQVGHDTGLRVGYYGQRNVKLYGSYDLNNVEPAAGTVQSRRPFQPYSAITVSNNAMFQSTVNQLQGGIQKRYSHGLLLGAEYQYTRVVGVESFQDPANWNDSRGSLSDIRKHVLMGSYVYDLPLGKGRPWLSGASGALQKVVGDWQLAGILQAMSGAPFSPSFTTSVVGSVGGRPDVVSGAALYPDNRTLTNYFNAAAFTKPANYTYGNTGYNILWGPGRWSWDASLLKKLPITERVNLDISIQAFSAFNHPMFALPATSISSSSTVGRITSSTGERTVALGGKLTF